MSVIVEIWLIWYKAGESPNTTMPIDENWLVEHYRRRILYFVLRRLRDRSAAEEVTQEVLLAAIGAVRKGKINESSELGSFVFAVAVNMIKKRFRDLASEARVFAGQDSLSNLPWLEDPEAALLVQERRQQVLEGLAQLSSDERELLLFCFEDPRPLREVARELGLSHAAVRKRKSRALEKLRKIVSKRVTNPNLTTFT